MKLDVNTLFLVSIYVEVVLGLLLLFAWVQNAALRAVAWWGFGQLLLAGAVTLFGRYGQISDLLAIDLANVLLFTAFACTWTGARLFDGKKPHYAGLAAGAALWLIASRLPSLQQAWDLRAAFSAAIISAYAWLSAYEFWRGRGEALVSRWPAIFMLAAYGALFLLRSPLGAVFKAAPAGEPVAGSVWLTVLSFEALLFTIAIAFILLAMTKERTEQRHKIAATIDPLTGLANRRAFLQGAEASLREAGEAGATCAVLLIDLDNFKSINDRFGHALGDRVLQAFAATVRKVVPAAAISGRLGGEEFAVLVPATEAGAAFTLAELLRTTFAHDAASIDQVAVKASLSMGVVLSSDGPPEIAPLLAAADQALYCAKDSGRNRVEMMSPGLLAARARRLAAPDVPAIVPARVDSAA